MFGISGEHLLILGIVLIFFGPRRLPELGNTLGKAIRNFKDALSGVEEAKFRRIDETGRPAAPLVTSAPPTVAQPTQTASVAAGSASEVAAHQSAFSQSESPQSESPQSASPQSESPLTASAGTLHVAPVNPDLIMPSTTPVAPNAPISIAEIAEAGAPTKPGSDGHSGSGGSSTPPLT